MQEVSKGEPSGAERVVDVVVPVFNGFRATQRCLASVLAAKTATCFELIVIDDASTDAELRSLLDTLAVAGRLTLIRNDANRGFVHSANLGLSLHSDRDVLLLNSDTEVAGDWLDRLSACAYRQSDIGTVTPFSNNATICSFPLPCRDNALPEEVTVAELDAVFAMTNAGQSLAIPTAVGFCMYIRRECLNATGLFDEAAFGRGYGEENDFCRRALAAGWQSVLCGDVFVFHSGSASFGADKADLIEKSEGVLRARHPEYFDEVTTFIRQDSAGDLRRPVEIELARRRRRQTGAAAPRFPSHAEAIVSYRSRHAKAMMAQFQGKPVQLHVVHDLGGGVERWCKDYCRADDARVNLILRPFCRGHAAGEGLMLFGSPFDDEPLQFWPFTQPFEVTATHHPEYAKAIHEIVRDYHVDVILVSSLIGHSLDVLALGRPTALVAHDYFPLCPAINLYYDGICQSCDDSRITDCLEHNPDFNSFPMFSAHERIEVRKRLLELIEDRIISVAVPDRSVWRHMEGLFPGLSKASWVTIPHGTDRCLKPMALLEAPRRPGRLKVMVLGVLSVNKGVGLLAETIDRLTEFAEVFLVGAQEVGEMFSGHAGVTVVTRYALDELQSIIERIRPDVGLLLSIWPETFSYTLSELMQAAIPPVATCVGAFSERIDEGETGFLVSPSAEAVLARLKTLADGPGLLDRVRENLIGLRHRNVAAMVADYHRLLENAAGTGHVPTSWPEPSRSDELVISQSLASATMWKRLKSLDLQLATCRESQVRQDAGDRLASSRQRMMDRQRGIAEHQRAVSEHQRTIAESQRAIAEQQRALAEVQFNEERRQLRRQIDEACSASSQHEKRLRDKEAQLGELKGAFDAQELRIHKILTSTSWRLSAPVRVVGGALRQARLVAGHVVPMLREPKLLGRRWDLLSTAWRTGGRASVKQTLLDIQAEIEHQEAWSVFHKTFARTVRAGIIQAVAGIAAPPMISVIVPTYKTRAAMLKQMVESVRGQLYPCWELCIADDGSGDDELRKALLQYAAEDQRIKVSLSDVNLGVAHASNRALAMAQGAFCVLLDHDDVLEEQALYRVAESMLEDDPDMVYSDEIMVSEHQDQVLQYAFRPAFSPELLRSHPYIVHLVGFRTSLLRQVGGFDERLRISQDYDLILRVAEQASRIVHIPEILYRWRIYGTSTGMQKIEEVTETSHGVLARHLARCGEHGKVNDGAGFNLFDTRYCHASEARVAIIIPTKDHGGLVRQCIDSIRATVEGVAYDIVVVDHESTDPATLEYLSSISGEVEVVPHSGPFNFSAINNGAVARLARPYSHYLFCNNDIEAVRPGWLGRMVELGLKPDIGVVGAQLLYPDRQTIQHAGVCVGAFGAAEHFGKFIRVGDIPRYLGFSEILRSNHEVSAVTAACLLIRRDAFDAVGGFDEAFAVGFGDVDLCLRVGQAGYRIVQCSHAELLHHESFTRGKSNGVDPHPKDSALFQSRWAGFMRDGDPYFNPALNVNSTAWLMKYPIPCHLKIRRRVWRRPEASRSAATVPDNLA